MRGSTGRFDFLDFVAVDQHPSAVENVVDDLRMESFNQLAGFYQRIWNHAGHSHPDIRGPGGPTRKRLSATFRN
jgi:hypothetical protein